MNYLLGPSPRAPQKASEILSSLSEVKSFLLTWPFFVIRTRMEINDSGLFSELKALREEGQLVPGPMQLWRGVIGNIQK